MESLSRFCRGFSSVGIRLLSFLSAGGVGRKDIAFGRRVLVRCGVSRVLVLGASAMRGDFEGVCNMVSMSQTTLRVIGGNERIKVLDGVSFNNHATRSSAK